MAIVSESAAVMLAAEGSSGAGSMPISNKPVPVDCVALSTNTETPLKVCGASKPGFEEPSSPTDTASVEDSLDAYSDNGSLDVPSTPPRNSTPTPAPAPVGARATLTLPAVSMAASSHADLVAAISAAVAAGAGVLRVTDLAPGAAPLAAVQELFDLVAARPDLVDRANAAYKRDKLIFKDTYASGKGGPSIDQKRVLDFSPARLDAVARVDPTLVADLGAPLAAALAFFDAVRTSEVPRLAAAVADAAGAPAVAGDALCNYRMVDYYQRVTAAADGGAPAGQPPRCGEHRDFGSFTLIFQDAVGGLEVLVPGADGSEESGSWAPVPAGGPGEAVLLFGWCTTFRSNGRVPAALHRVTSPPAAENPDGGHAERRRLSAVLFVAPEAEASLAPEVREGERARFRGVAAGELRKEVGRKWQYREGTLTEEEMRAQTERLAKFPTQDAYIAHAYGL